MNIVINGEPRDFTDLSDPATVADLVSTLNLKGDRVAIEQNGDIVPRPKWAETPLTAGDKLEIVHFVGGGRR
jgi:thiamine biosynthesis protein ThiS